MMKSRRRIALSRWGKPSPTYRWYNLPRIGVQKISPPWAAHRNILASIGQAKKLKRVVLDACRDNISLRRMRCTSAPEV
jgi:hypothetical protein